MLTLDSLLKIDNSLVEPASITCARAFENDSFTRWLIPNPAKRANIRYPFKGYLRMAAANSASMAFTTSQRCEGVITYMPAETKFSLFTMLDAGYPFTSLRCGWRYLWLDSKSTSMCDKLRKKLAPPRYCYLALLAVDPAYQGQGIASALIKPILQMLDKDNMPCYLETQNLKNVEMYQHFGFKLMHQTNAPGGEHPLYFMLRQL
ncbi:MAG: GNAT family N-acetyltransferase [Dehalococcoidia bacterium]|nr:GNAT family N-acetyltransferase [Dehalococcoidia bacterium]